MEVNCETDFVAKTDDFKSFCRDLCMQIAAAKPGSAERQALIDQRSQLDVYKALVTGGLNVGESAEPGSEHDPEARRAPSGPRTDQRRRDEERASQIRRSNGHTPLYPQGYSGQVAPSAATSVGDRSARDFRL